MAVRNPEKIANAEAFDVVIIGSGFGGGVMSLRLAEAGIKVCLLERGKEYGMQEFPKTTDEIQKDYFWDPEDKKYGPMELRVYPGSDNDCHTVTGSGLGGSSLIYGAVMFRMDEEYFAGWPEGINRNTLDPFYSRATDMLGAEEYPFKKDPYHKDTPKTWRMREAYNTLSQEPNNTGGTYSLKKPDLAIRFKKEDEFPGQQVMNEHGKLQSSCIKCGECNLGCRILAKNTVDLNYIARARNEDLMGPGSVAITVKTEAEAARIEPHGDGYGLKYKDYTVAEGNPYKWLKAKKVILAAGSVGSTKLLLQMKDKGVLNKLGPMLGKKWNANGDFAGVAMECHHTSDPSKGPSITTAIEWKPDTSPDPNFPYGLYVEDASLPPVLIRYAIGDITSLDEISHFLNKAGKPVEDLAKYLFTPNQEKEINIGGELARFLKTADADSKLLFFVGMGRDVSKGEIKLRGDGEVEIVYQLQKNRYHYDKLNLIMSKVAKSIAKEYRQNLFTKIDKMFSLHPLGGCPMGNFRDEGVVDTKGEVFGHPGLYVVDGSILPTSTGVNPALTIAAVAEMIAEKFVENW